MAAGGRVVLPVVGWLRGWLTGWSTRTSGRSRKRSSSVEVGKGDSGG